MDIKHCIKAEKNTAVIGIPSHEGFDASEWPSTI